MTTRLSVNINDDCAEALRRVKAAHGITTTEAIRRAISLLDHFEKARQLRCVCPVGSDAIGPHLRACPNHPEHGR